MNQPPAGTLVGIDLCFSTKDASGEGVQPFSFHFNSVDQSIFGLGLFLRSTDAVSSSRGDQFIQLVFNLIRSPYHGHFGSGNRKLRDRLSVFTAVKVDRYVHRRPAAS